MRMCFKHIHNRVVRVRSALVRSQAVFGNKMMWLCWIVLLVAIAFGCSSLAPGSGLHKSALRAFDASVFMLGRGGGDDEDDEDGLPERARRVAPHTPRTRGVTREPPSTGRSCVAARRKRISPFIAKLVGSSQSWRCAACGELLTEDFEVDHHISLQNGGSDDIENLRPLHKRCHLLKNSLEQRRS